MTRTVVRGKGEGGGDRETGTTIRQRPTSVDYSSSYKARYAYRRVKDLKTIERGAVSYTPPPTPEPSTTSCTGRGEIFHTLGRWTENQEQGIGRKSVGRLTDG